MNGEPTNVEKLVRDALTAHEHVAPDGDEVFAAARARIDRRRTALNRPLAVAAGVAALTLAAGTVAVLNRPGPADGVAAPADQVRTTAPASSAPAGPVVPDLAMPFSLGWLPPGSVDYLARRINIGSAAEAPDTPLYGGEYMLTVTAGGQVLLIDVQQFRMVSVDEAAFKSGPGRPVTVNGQRAVESANPGGPGGYELYVAHPDGGSVYVNVANEPGGTVPAEQLVEVGRRVAREIGFPGTTTVTPAFGLRDLPGDLRVCAFNVGRSPSSRPGQSTSYSLGTCATMPPITVGTADPETVTGTPGEPVQGRETRYADEGGYHRLWVLDAVDGAPVHLAGRVPPAELRDLADRLVLPG
ncbi:hypothetical protein [Saccharothrix syringae]|uniref:DUF4367 domain-containing protein n=1 Tax=Saccharothrix syringae TaxID=103733 RepID=A0A5Q0GZJ9_SACSY|nr:hypothetical protein [Saccharothrix syringae]QFZ18822.1 hypothetical protein EKG83_16420 [Saccharothrix syringae]